MKILDVTKFLPKHPSKRYKTRNVHEIDRIVIHHSATQTGTPKAFANYHVKNRNWPGIGYTYVIMPDGLIFQTNADRTISYHASGANRSSIGICLVGNFDQQSLELSQKRALIGLCHLLIKRYPRITRIVGHREVPATKSCPGKKINLPGLRREILGRDA